MTAWRNFIRELYCNGLRISRSEANEELKVVLWKMPKKADRLVVTEALTTRVFEFEQQLFASCFTIKTMVVCEK